MLFLCYPFQFLPLFSSFSAYPFGVIMRSWPALCRLRPAQYHKRQRYSVFKVLFHRPAQSRFLQALHLFSVSSWVNIRKIAFSFQATRPPPCNAPQATLAQHLVRDYAWILSQPPPLWRDAPGLMRCLYSPGRVNYCTRKSYIP